MKSNEKKYWFPAKKYGWGWGPPCCWQGWAVLIAWIGLETVGAFLLLKNPPVLVIYSIALVIILMVICFIKGEKPGWHWGGK